MNRGEQVSLSCLASSIDYSHPYHLSPSHLSLFPQGDDAYRRAIMDCMQLGCVPVLLPDQRAALTYEMGGIIRRANHTVDEVFYFLPHDQIRDAEGILRTLLNMAEDLATMQRWRQALQAVTRYMLFSDETMDDALTVSLGLVLAGEHH